MQVAYHAKHKLTFLGSDTDLLCSALQTYRLATYIIDNVKQDPIEIIGEILGSNSLESMAFVVLMLFYFRLLCFVVLCVDISRGILS